VGSYGDDYRSVVMQTFVWAFPHQYRVAAAPGSRVMLDLGPVGAWTLTSDGSRWDLGPRAAGDAHVAEVHADHSTGWRWLTGGDLAEGALQTSGPTELVEALPQVRAILVWSPGTTTYDGCPRGRDSGQEDTHCHAAARAFEGASFRSRL
jgi:hypothetical protein